MPVARDHALMASQTRKEEKKKQAKGGGPGEGGITTEGLLIKSECTPKRGGLDCCFIIIPTLVFKPMETHLNGQSDALASIVPALRIPTAARLPD